MTESEKNKNIPAWRQRIRRALLVMSFIMFPVTFAYLSCPIITDGASQGIITGGLIVFGLIFFTSLVVGRMWCGYLCPAGSLQEMICTRVNDRNVRIGKLNGLKYLTFLGVFGGIVYNAYISGGFTSIDLFYGTGDGVSIAAAGAVGMFYGPVAIIALFALFGGKRSACHYWCPIAVIPILGRKIHNLIRWPALHLEVEPWRCVDCKKCSQECPMSLDVNAMVRQEKMELEQTECILCGACVDTCPQGAIRYAWTEKKQQEQIPHPRNKVERC